MDSGLYNQSGAPTATLLEDPTALVDYTLYWITCQNIREANYLLAIINSDVLYESVESLMPKGQFGARHLQKHLWKLPIPEFDPARELHAAIAEAGATAAARAKDKLEELWKQREQSDEKLTVTIARRELRKWLRASPEGRAVESGVSRLLRDGAF